LAQSNYKFLFLLYYN